MRTSFRGWSVTGLVYFVEGKKPLPIPTPYSCFWVVYLVVNIHVVNIYMHMSIIICMDV